MILVKSVLRASSDQKAGEFAMCSSVPSEPHAVKCSIWKAAFDLKAFDAVRQHIAVEIYLAKIIFSLVFLYGRETSANFSYLGETVGSPIVSRDIGNVQFG